MDWEKWCLRVGAAAVGCALVVRLLSGGLLDRVLQGLTHPEVVSAIVFMETGRMLRPIEEPQPTQPVPETSPVTVPVEETQAQTEATEPAYAVFAEQDADLVEVNSVCGYDADLPALLQKPLSWDLKKEEPTVLIVHTHGTEAYTKTPDANYQNHAAFRTTDDRYNMISIGDELTRLLEAEGIHVIHDRTAHDYLDYDNAYENSRKAVQAYLKEYPSIKLVLDIHRDALTNSDGSQIATSATVNGKPSAQLMYVSGSNASATHPNWQKNLSLIEKLHVVTEKNFPGVTRPINLRAKAYNQDLSVGSLLVEVGSAGNTHAEAMNAVPALAEAIIALAWGAE